MRSLLASILFCSTALTFAQEAEVSQAAYLREAQQATKDLESALKQLSEQRLEIAKEKPALSEETIRLGTELREAKRLARLAVSDRREIEEALEAAKSTTASIAQEKSYLDNMLASFRREHESRLPIVALQARKESLPPSTASSQDLFALLESALQRLEPAERATFQTSLSVVQEDGKLVAGQAVEAGPVAWFTTEDGRQSGLLKLDNALSPSLVSGSGSMAAQVKALSNGQTANLTIDPSLGDAERLQTQSTNLVDQFKQGGVWVLPIVGMAILVICVALFKWIEIARIRRVSSSKVTEIIDLIKEERYTLAKEESARLSHPAGSILESAAIAKEEKNEEAEEFLYERFLAAQPKLSRGLYLIALAAATAPLLGLLGTVTGMIETFQKIEIFGTSDPKMLSSGISKALITTEFGLIVAIPALILHALIARRIKGIRNTMEMISLTALHALGLRKAN